VTTDPSERRSGSRRASAATCAAFRVKSFEYRRSTNDRVAASSDNANGGRAVDPVRANPPRSPPRDASDPTPRATAPAVLPAAPAAPANMSGVSNGCSTNACPGCVTVCVRPCTTPRPSRSNLDVSPPTASIAPRPTS
jgi:hypothetical protein